MTPTNSPVLPVWIQCVLMIIIGYCSRLRKLSRRYRLTTTLIIAGALIGLGYCAGSATAETRTVNWACQDWESHNAHFEPAARRDFDEARRQAYRMMANGSCRVSDLSYEIETVAMIGEVPYRGSITEAWMVRLGNGEISYTVLTR